MPIGNGHSAGWPADARASTDRNRRIGIRELVATAGQVTVTPVRSWFHSNLVRARRVCSRSPSTAPARRSLGSASVRGSSPIKDVRHASEMVIDYALPKAGLKKNFAHSASLTGRDDLAQLAKKAARPKAGFCAPRSTLTSPCRSERHLHRALLLPNGTFIPPPDRSGAQAGHPLFPVQTEAQNVADQDMSEGCETGRPAKVPPSQKARCPN